MAFACGIGENCGIAESQTFSPCLRFDWVTRIG